MGARQRLRQRQALAQEVTENPLTINGRTLEAGVTELSITKERGRFTYQGINADGSINVYGGPPGRERFRSFRIDRVKTVHRKILNRKNQPKENHQ